MWREPWNVNDEACAKAPRSSVLSDHLAIGRDVRSADLVDVGLDEERLLEIVQEIVERDRLNPRAHPAGTHHRGEPFGEVAKHLERNAPRTEHHRSSQLHHVDAGGSKSHTDLVAAGEVCGTGSVSECPDVDDATDVRLRRGASESGREPEVEISKLIAGGHRVNEVVGSAHVRQGAGGGDFVTEVDHD